MSTQNIRNGKGHRAYRRKRDALKRRAQRENMTCSWCGQPFDFTLDYNHPLAFTADHPEAIGNGGDLVKQDLEPMHKSCNSKRGNHQELDVELWEAS